MIVMTREAQSASIVSVGKVPNIDSTSSRSNSARSIRHMPLTSTLFVDDFDISSRIGIAQSEMRRHVGQ